MCKNIKAVSESSKHNYSCRKRVPHLSWWIFRPWGRCFCRRAWHPRCPGRIPLTWTSGPPRCPHPGSAHRRRWWLSALRCARASFCYDVQLQREETIWNPFLYDWDGDVIDFAGYKAVITILVKILYRFSLTKGKLSFQLAHWPIDSSNFKTQTKKNHDKSTKNLLLPKDPAFWVIKTILTGQIFLDENRTILKLLLNLKTFHCTQTICVSASPVLFVLLQFAKTNLSFLKPSKGGQMQCEKKKRISRSVKSYQT